MRFKKILIPIILIVLAGFTAWYFLSGDETESQVQTLRTTVERGEFNVYVTAEGELMAKRSKKIMGPASMRTAQIYETTIQDMVAEGTVVKEGDYVAQLDRTEIQTKINDINVEIDKILNQLEQAKIDTNIEMRGLRDELVNLNFAMEENKLQVELNKYEPQAIIRQKNIELEKSQREYTQQEAKISLTKEKNKAKIQEIMATLRQEQNKFDRLQKLSDEFNIKAPAEGMVIYARSWEGKVTPGSRLRAWDPVVAELPDLTEMISKTYINEVDISKVKPGMEVVITVDAFPDRSYEGIVQKVANIGEQLRNTDSKVFEVITSVEQTDSILRPAMTTRIEVLTESYEDVLFVPLEALQTDSLPFVYKKLQNGIVRQEVMTAASNDMHALIALGLDEGDEVYLSKPEDDKVHAFEYLQQAEKDRMQSLLEEQRMAMENALKDRQKQVSAGDIETANNSGGGIIIF